MNPRLVFGATLFSTPGMKAAGGHFPTLLSIIILAALLLVLVSFVISRGGSRPKPPDTDLGDGWGRGGPKSPEDRPRGPQGGIPLPLDDAVQTRVRLRTGERLKVRLPPRSRRPAREPERRPARPRTTT